MSQKGSFPFSEAGSQGSKPPHLFFHQEVLIGGEVKWAGSWVGEEDRSKE